MRGNFTYDELSKIRAFGVEVLNIFHLSDGPYYTSKVVKEKAKELGIEMVYLPPYSPNLNPIERVWKIMNEVVRNNVFLKQLMSLNSKLKPFLLKNGIN